MFEIVKSTDALVRYVSRAACPTTRLTLAPFFIRVPARGDSLSTRPFFATPTCRYVSFPLRQCRARRRAFATRTRFPTTLGTRHFGPRAGGGGGGGGGAGGGGPTIGCVPQSGSPPLEIRAVAPLTRSSTYVPPLA